MSFRCIQQNSRLAIPRPLDLVGTTPYLAVSANRRMRGAYTGPLMRVRRTSDSAERNIGQAGGGFLDKQDLLSWAVGTDARLATLYDQSGNGNDMSQGVAANQAGVVSGGGLISTGGLVAPIFDGGSDSIGVDQAGQNQPTTVIFAFYPITHNLLFEYAVYDGGGSGGFDQACLQANIADTYRMESGGTAVNATDLAAPGVPHIFAAVFDGASSSIQIDENAPQAIVLGTDPPLGLTLASWGGGAGGFTNIIVFEVMQFESALSASDINLLRNNLNAFYRVW